MAGKAIKNDKQKGAILGSIAGAQHVRLMAKHYGIPVILHSDHCAKKLLEWFDGMLEADEAYFKVSILLTIVTKCANAIIVNIVAFIFLFIVVVADNWQTIQCFYVLIFFANVKHGKI